MPTKTTKTKATTSRTTTKAVAKVPSTKTTTKTPATATSKAKGVIDTIIECLTKATKTKPITKAELHQALIKQFPDRGEVALRRTLDCQVPSRLRKDKGIEVARNDKTPAGYWISK